MLVSEKDFWARMARLEPNELMFYGAMAYNLGDLFYQPGIIYICIRQQSTS